MKSSELVFQIKCSCEKIYIGQTKRKLETIIYQQKKYCEELNKNKVGKIPLATHRFEENPNFDFNGAKRPDLIGCDPGVELIINIKIVLK